MAASAPSASTSSWTPSSWRTRPVAQDVAYPDAAALEAVTQRLAVLPGLVTPGHTAPHGTADDEAAARRG